MIKRRKFLKQSALWCGLFAFPSHKLFSQTGYELVGRAGNAAFFVNRTDSRKKRTVLFTNKRWLPDGRIYNDRDLSSSKLEIETPNFNIKNTGRTIDFVRNGFNFLSKQVEIQKQVGASWVTLDQSFVTFANRIRETEYATWEFKLSTKDGDLYIVYAIDQNGKRKWHYEFWCNTPGVYRFQLRHEVKGGAVDEVYRTKKTNQIYCARINYGKKRIYYNWKDIIDAGLFDSVRNVSPYYILNTLPQSLKGGETMVVDPSFSDDADWGADITSSNKYPSDGADYCGGDGSSSYRVANKFTISSLPVDDQVDQVDFQIDVSTVVSAGSLLWDIGPYNGDGQADPESDAAATAYSRCDMSSDNYVNDDTNYRTTGSKTLTDLGSQANADLEAARDAGTIFSIACHETTDTTSSNRCLFSEYDEGDPPTLTVTHSTPTSERNGKILFFNN